MFSNTKLKTKLFALLFSLLAGLIVLGAIIVFQTYEELQLARLTKTSMDLLKANTSFVHVLQRERGRSTLYVSGGVELDDLMKYRNETDEKSKVWDDVLRKSALSEKDKTYFLELVKEIDNNRRKVDAKNSTKDVVLNYSNLIKSIMRIENSIIRQKTSPGLGRIFTTISILEEAKESAGKLRAGVSSLLVQNAALSNDELTTLLTNKAGIDVTVESNALLVSDESQKKLIELRQTDYWKSINKTFLKVVTLSSQGNYGEDPKAYFNDITKMIDLFGQIIDDECNTIIKRIDDLIAQKLSVFWMISASCLIGSFVSLGFGYLLTRNIDEIIKSLKSETDMIIAATREGDLSKRANVEIINFEFQGIVLGINQTLNEVISSFDDAMKVMSELSNKNLTAQMNGSYKGDLLKFKNNINQTLTELKTTLVSVIEGVEQVNGGAEQVASASNSLSRGAQDQAAALEQISSTLTEVTAQTQVNLGNALQVNSLSEKAKIQADAGNAKMSQMIDSMTKINTASQGISKIIKVIDEIAFQTNLLALNAAVEAARAGKHGKGFAVVAEEVRNLAARSAKAAKETTELIEDSRIKVEMGVTTAHETEVALGSIIEGIVQIVSIANEISVGSTTQNESMKQITLALSQVDRVTQANAAAAEQCASSSEELSSQANVIHRLIKEFHV